MVILTIESLGEERFIRGFSRISSEIKDFSVPFKLILEDFRNMESGLLASEGTSEGEARFKPLSERYRKWKEQHFPGRRIMFLTGKTTAALTGKAEGTVEKINRTSAEFGVELPWTHRHQMGTHGMPRRRIVQLSDKRKFRWTRIFARWAMGLFDRWIGQGIGNYNREATFR